MTKVFVAVYDTSENDLIYVGETLEAVTQAVRDNLTANWKEYLDAKHHLTDDALEDIEYILDIASDDEFFNAYFEKYPEEGLTFHHDLEVIE